jgi:tetratricopeptide (TPR) repeat protein
MTWKKWLPPSELLAEVKGVEKGLIKGSQLRKRSNLGLLLATAQFVVVASQSDLWAWASDSAGLSPGQQAISGISLAAAVLGFLFWLRTRTWLSESKQPFRYTCSIGNFDPVRPTKGRSEVAPLKDDLRHDLGEKLNERIGRLTFLDEELIAADPESEDRSHIHIRGHYLVRKTPSDIWRVEVTPRVRIGGKSSPETLAHPIKFALDIGSNPSHGRQRIPRIVSGIPEPPKESRQSPAQVEKEYERILEWVYFSVATQIYKRLRQDVEGKIRLLPSRYLRATSYLHEADDYARSNTLDAYDEAQVFYGRAMELYDPALRILPHPWFRKPLARSHQVLATWVIFPLGRKLSYFWPRMARRQIMAARAQIGYASSLINRRILAGMSGHRMNSVYEARPLLQRTIRLLKGIPIEVDGCRDALFDAHATEALLWHYLKSTRRTKSALDNARRLSPRGSDENARYLLAAGLAEVSPRRGIPLLRIAVEQDPRSEIAQCELAEKSEMIWRTRFALEHSSAELVLEEYEKVLRINPGNVRAWANLGYMHWLLQDFTGARQAFLRGRDYKNIKPGTYVAEIDLGLARTTAEQGHFDEAYKYYVSATSSRIAQGSDHERETSAQYYFFDFIGPAMLRRFEDYSTRVLFHLSRANQRGDIEPSQRVRDSVAAFVLNDFGEACRDYYSRTGDERQIDWARRCFLDATRHYPRYVMPHFNLHLLALYDVDRNSDDEARELKTQAMVHVEAATQLEPSWPDAVLAKVNANALGAQQALDIEMRSGSEEKRQQDHTERLRAAEEGSERVGVEKLVPHAWLWNRPNPKVVDDFKWRAVRRRDYKRQRRWERELDDLQVRALFAWTLSRLLSRVGTKGSVASIGTLKDPLLPVRLRNLLRHIRDCYWPADWSVLWACRTILSDKDVEKDLLDCARRKLLEDPAGYAALDFVGRKFFIPGDSSTFRLFERFKEEERVQIVAQGLSQQFISGPSKRLLGSLSRELEDKELWVGEDGERDLDLETHVHDETRAEELVALSRRSGSRTGNGLNIR